MNACILKFTTSFLSQEFTKKKERKHDAPYSNSGKLTYKAYFHMLFTRQYFPKFTDLMWGEKKNIPLYFHLEIIIMKLIMI